MPRSPALVVCLVLALASTVRALPDLVPEIYGVEVDTDQTVGSGDVAEGCAGSTSGNTLIRFGVRIHNQGTDDERVGDPGCPNCALFPGAPCNNPDFVCSPADGHMHPHFESLGRYDLLDAAGNVVAVGAKRGFCMRDDGPASNPGCSNYICTNQGITAGCYDDYSPDLGCQYVDATRVPGIGRRAFRLRVTVDPLQLLAESDRSNDAVEVLIPGCGDGVLGDGEECEPATEPCCDADCHRIADCDAGCFGRPAGAACRPATGPCDAAETCDGVSPTCPPDGARADGAACGGEQSACMTTVCRAGRCTAERDAGGCFVEGACFPAGAADPADPCQRCDPSRTIDLWTPNRDPDASGVACQLARVEHATQAIDCPLAVERALAARLKRADALVARVERPRGKRQLMHLVSRLTALLRRGERRGCRASSAEAEVASLRTQLRALEAARR